MPGPGLLPVSVKDSRTVRMPPAAVLMCLHRTLPTVDKERCIKKKRPEKYCHQTEKTVYRESTAAVCSQKCKFSIEKSVLFLFFGTQKPA